MKTSNLVKSEYSCCGCGACKAVCPKNAITIKANEFGFDYPVIDETKCIDCKKCLNVCVFENKPLLSKPESCYAGVSTNTDVLASASGGVFASIATEFINDGGIAVGAALVFDGDKLNPCHFTADNLNDLKKLLGSKYVQSKTDEIFPKVKSLLEEKKNVLFSGTPCQTAALKSYLARDYDNLYTIDLICHGVPSRQMFHDFLDYISKENSKVTDFVFRDKTKGITFVSKACFSSKGKKYNKYFQYGENAYYHNFLKGNIYRDCCYECPFARADRVSDLTIGDFWGIEKQHPELFDSARPEFDTEKGISCLLQNTEKGKFLLENYGQGLSLFTSSFDKISKENQQLSSPSVPKGNREQIMNAYKNGGYEEFHRYFVNSVGKKQIIKSKIKKHIPLSVKKLIKSL